MHVCTVCLHGKVSEQTHPRGSSGHAGASVWSLRPESLLNGLKQSLAFVLFCLQQACISVTTWSHGGVAPRGHKAVPGDVPAALDGKGAEARDAALTLRRPGRPRRESGLSRRRGRGREPPSSQDSQDTPPRLLLLSPRSCSSRLAPTSSCHPCDIFMS